MWADIGDEAKDTIKILLQVPTAHPSSHTPALTLQPLHLC